MCYSDPRKSLALARERLTPEQWSKFEREFSVFCDIHGLPDKWAYWPTYDWAKWAFWCARPKPEPQHKFAIIRDRNYEGEGISLWTWNGENYSGADGDCLSPDPDGTLDGFTAEWFTDYQLEKRLNADQRVASAHFERIGLAMMSDEQAEASLERWRGVKGESE